MKKRQDAMLVDAVNLLSKMKPPPKLVLPEDKVECLCKRWVPVTDLEYLDTGVITVLNNVCRKCAEGHAEDGKLARVVCCKCKAVVARVVPHTDKAGFEFKAGKSYHIAECGGCTPGLEVSVIIEKKLHDKRKGMIL